MCRMFEYTIIVLLAPSATSCAHSATDDDQRRRQIASNFGIRVGIDQTTRLCVGPLPVICNRCRASFHRSSFFFPDHDSTPPVSSRCATWTRTRPLSAVHAAHDDPGLVVARRVSSAPTQSRSGLDRPAVISPAHQRGLRAAHGHRQVPCPLKTPPGPLLSLPLRAYRLPANGSGREHSVGKTVPGALPQRVPGAHPGSYSDLACSPCPCSRQVALRLART